MGDARENKMPRMVDEITEIESITICFGGPSVEIAKRTKILDQNTRETISVSPRERCSKSGTMIVLQ